MRRTKPVNPHDNPDTLGLRQCSDAYQQGREVIVNRDHTILYERFKITTTHQFTPDTSFAISRWTNWQKLIKPEPAGKLWHSKSLTLSDIITGNF